MSSQRKITSARANGAKSLGPSTDAGRKASSMNATTHGLYSRGVVLQTESQDQYREALDAYIQQFQPQGPAEFHLVEEMVAAKWRQRRLWAIEADFLDEETTKQQSRLEDKDDPFNEITPLSKAYAKFASCPILPFLIRNESRLERAYFRALKSLLDLQRLRKPPTTQKMQERTQSQIRTTTEPPVTNHQPPATSHQSPTTNHQPPPPTTLTSAPPIR